MNLFRIFKERRDLRGRMDKLDKQNVELADTLESERAAHGVFVGKVSLAADRAFWNHRDDVNRLSIAIRGLVSGEVSPEAAIACVEEIEGEFSRHSGDQPNSTGGGAFMERLELFRDDLRRHVEAIENNPPTGAIH